MEVHAKCQGQPQPPPNVARTPPPSPAGIWRLLRRSRQPPLRLWEQECHPSPRAERRWATTCGVRRCRETAAAWRRGSPGGSRARNASACPSPRVVYSESVFRRSRAEVCPPLLGHPRVKSIDVDAVRKTRPMAWQVLRIRFTIPCDSILHVRAFWRSTNVRLTCLRRKDNARGSRPSTRIAETSIRNAFLRIGCGLAGRTSTGRCAICENPTVGRSCVGVVRQVSGGQATGRCQEGQTSQPSIHSSGVRFGRVPGVSSGWLDWCDRDRDCGWIPFWSIAQETANPYARGAHCEAGQATGRIWQWPELPRWLELQPNEARRTPGC